MIMNLVVPTLQYKIGEGGCFEVKTSENKVKGKQLDVILLAFRYGNLDVNMMKPYISMSSMLRRVLSNWK